MRHLDLFSGIGGFAIATEMVWENVEHTFVEIDPFCQEVLKKHWPQSHIHGDIKTFKGTGTVDLLTGGFPCQPFSSAGKRKSKDDNRYLWPEMLRVIKEYRPRWITCENVAGIVRLALDEVLSDLESEDYTCQTFIIPACSVNAPHRRDRVWIVAHSNNNGRDGTKDTEGQAQGNNYHTERPHELCEPQRGGGLWPEDAEWNDNWEFRATLASRMDDGIPNRLHRIKALGNSIVPQIAAAIMKGIKDSTPHTCGF